MLKLYFTALLITFTLSLTAQNQECFLLMVGKEASASGQVLLAHNNDLTGTEASMLVKIPANKKLNILPDSSLSFNQNYTMLVLQTNIGFEEGDAVAVNEHSVSVAGGLSLKKDRNKNAEKIDPLISSGLGGGVRYLALQHAKTAKECIGLIGKLYNEFGISYPSGVGVADTNEIWYMETGGGHSWAAVRIPMDSYFVGANSYRIEYISFEDTLNFLYSPNLPDICEENNLWNENGTFNFRNFFGNGVKEKEGNNYYNTRRLWRTMDILNPTLSISPESEDFPFSLQPEQKVDLHKCFSILRDYYKNTPFDIFKETNINNPERSIAVWKCVHTDIISLTPGLPVDYGSVIWTGLSSPFTTVYIPVYYSVSTIPEKYGYAPSEYNQNSAFWIFKQAEDSNKSNYPIKMESWIKHRNKFESIEIEEQNKIIKEAENIYNYNPNQLHNYLGKITDNFAQDAINLSINK